jgi:hypothetical protein
MRREAVDRRLGDLERRLPLPPEVAARDRRCLLRWRAAIGTYTGAMVALAGIDPATIPALRQGEDAARELRALGDTAVLAAADSAVREAGRQAQPADPGEADQRARVVAKLDRYAAACQAGEMPTANAPLILWFTWATAFEAAVLTLALFCPEALGEPAA